MVVFLADYPLSQLSNATHRSVWVKQQVELATKQHTDGINIDFEKPLSPSRSELLTALVNETVQAFRAVNPYTQVGILHRTSLNCLLFFLSIDCFVQVIHHDAPFHIIYTSDLHFSY